MEKKIRDLLKENDFEVVESVGINNIYGLWAMSKDRSKSININFEELPDEEIVEEFNEHLEQNKI